jgi:hypothetical protein
MKDLVFAIVFLCGWAGIPNSMIAIADLPIFVGVIEDVEPNNLSPAMSGAHVRIAFRKQGSAWIPMKSNFDTREALAQADRYFPTTVNWTVVFNGKQIGAIASKSSGQLQWYGDVGTQIITTKAANIPRISTDASNFRYVTWRARTRPLLLVSAPNFKDPESWKPATLFAAEKSLAIKEFRKRFPLLEQCDRPEEQPIHMVPYSDDEIIFMKVAYRSNTGEAILGLRLDETRSKCEFYGDERFFDYWFALKTNRSVQLLGSRMTPMDAADLDDSGKSAWIFHTSREEDEDGYELFYDDFSKKAAFYWTYH